MVLDNSRVSGIQLWHAENCCKLESTRYNAKCIAFVKQEERILEHLELGINLLSDGFGHLASPETKCVGWPQIPRAEHWIVLLKTDLRKVCGLHQNLRYPTC